jgi:predicted heme/steroid binding protein/uncharacterized membrane protein
MKEFTADELARFNGKEGNPVYVAFQGKVYDLSGSRLWLTGTHMKRHPSGRDLAAEITAAPHGPDVLDRFLQVGVLRSEAPDDLAHLPSCLRQILVKVPMARRHPHPMVVHFPIALFMSASFFLLLHALFRTPSLEVTSFHLLILGALSSPFAIGTGFLTWWINYRLRPNPLIRKKIAFSSVLVLMEAVLLVWRSGTPDLASGAVSPVYLGLMLLLAPVVGLVGYYGGQLTFPE